MNVHFPVSEYIFYGRINSHCCIEIIKMISAHEIRPECLALCDGGAYACVRGLTQYVHGVAMRYIGSARTQ